MQQSLAVGAFVQLWLQLGPDLAGVAQPALVQQGGQDPAPLVLGPLLGRFVSH